jgi:hypothetical protein
MQGDDPNVLNDPVLREYLDNHYKGDLFFKETLIKLYRHIDQNIDSNFEKTIQYNMISWCVPHNIFPAGYHVNPKEPLPFLQLSAQKKHISIYHMGLYSDPDLMGWFLDSHKQERKQKLSMGKSCIRYSQEDHIAWDTLTTLLQKIPPQDWVLRYEQSRKSKNSNK